MASLLANPLLRGYPLSYKIHALVCLSIGPLTVFSPSLVLTNPLWIKLHSLFGLSYAPPSTASPLGSTLSNPELQQWSNIGVLITAIGLINVSVAGRPGGYAIARELSKVRLTVALLCAGLWVFKPESRDLVKALIMVEDGIGGLLTGWQMGF